MSAIGKRTIDLFVGADIPFYDPATQTVSTRYWSNRSWITNPNDSVAANRQYVGLLLQGFDFDYSWFSGDQLGGHSTRNFGQLRAFNPDGTHNQNDIFEDGLTVQGQTITFRLGEIGDDLADMVTRQVEGRQVRQSEDGTEVVIDLSDEGQALDTSIFIDRFQGLGFALEHAQGEFSTIPSDAGLNPSTSFVVDVSYALTPGLALSGDVSLLNRGATAGGRLYRLYAKPAGTMAFAMRSSTSDVFLDATDIPWVADGRFHRVVGRWNGTTMHLFHSTRTGGVKSTTSSAVSTIDTSATALSVGDENSGLAATNGWVRIADVRVAIDTPLTDTQIIDRMKRPLTAAEIADYEVYVKVNENTGSTSADETGNGHTLTKHASATWEPTFEGRDEMAGLAKPLSFGRIFNAPVTWVDRANGLAVVHSRGIRAIPVAYEGGNRLIVGWPKRRFYSVSFLSANKSLTIDEHAQQPSFQGLVNGQKLVIAGTTSNNGTKTVDFVTSTAGFDGGRRVVLTDAVTTEGPVDCYITALNETSTQPDLEVWHDAGGVRFKSVPTLPATCEIFGDLGADVPSNAGHPDDVWSQYIKPIIKTILRDWGGVTSFDADTWDFSTSGIWGYRMGVWLDPGRDRTIRDVIDDGATSAWFAVGTNPLTGEWMLGPDVPGNPYAIAAPTGTPDVDLTVLKILGLRRIRSVPPVGGLSMRGVRNYRTLEADEIAGAATAADIANLQRPYIEVAAVVDSTVAASYPDAAVPPAIDTWQRDHANSLLQGEVQRRYDILKVDREMYAADAILYGLDQNPLSTLLQLTDEDFPTLVSGKKFWLVHLQARDEEVVLTGWG